MVFSSVIFLLVFLPLVLAMYYLVPGRALKNILLLLVSIVFYAWGEPVYVVLMVVSICVNWLCGVLMERLSSSKRLLLVLCLLVNLGILGFFKYEGFLAANINALLGAELVPQLQLALPIGISFYTLQALSYVIDVYRGEVPAQRNVLYLGMYIAMFPQLVAGPIVRYSDIQEQVLNRKESLRKFSSGIRLFCIGLGKKVLLANVVAILATKMLADGVENIGAVGAWAGLIAYTFQILFDFSGYSDMAIGLGKMFGFEYRRNFNYPYISRSVTEFWRRWHISLGSFFRDYVYIPLGGNRVSRSRWVVNLFVVWLLTGFWHGAAWNFILWGLFYGCLLAFEKVWLGQRLAKLPQVIQHIYAILAFMAGWLIFWIEDLGTMGAYIATLFGAHGLTGQVTMWELTAWEYLPIFACCVLASTPVVPWLREKLVAWACGRPSVSARQGLAHEKSLGVECQCDYERWLEEAASAGASKGKQAVLQVVFVATDVLCVALLVASVLSVVSGSFNPFIYFRF